MFSLTAIRRHASRAEHYRSWHVAVLIRSGKVVAIGHNHQMVHAEMMALSQIWPNRRQNLTLWSYRVGRRGQLLMALPCEDCTKALIENGIRKVHFSDPEGKMRQIYLF